MADTVESLIAQLNALELRIAQIEHTPKGQVHGLVAGLGQEISALRSELERTVDTQIILIDTLRELLPDFGKQFEQKRIDAKRKQQEWVEGAVQSIEERLNKKH